MADYQRALHFVLRWEGGFSDDPDDPGGRTNRGITQQVYRDYLHDPEADVAAITADEVGAIYKSQYWAPLCLDLADPLALVVFDSAVNCGVGRTRSWLLKSRVALAGTDSAARFVLTVRRLHYENLVVESPKMVKYLHGWMNRLEALRDEAGLSGPDFSDVRGGASTR